jgi:hypothetical protein
MATRVGSTEPLASFNCAMCMTWVSASSKSLFELSRMFTSGAGLEAVFAAALVSRSGMVKSVVMVEFLLSRAVPTADVVLVPTLSGALWLPRGDFANC